MQPTVSHFSNVHVIDQFTGLNIVSLAFVFLILYTVSVPIHIRTQHIVTFNDQESCVFSGHLIKALFVYRNYFNCVAPLGEEPKVSSQGVDMISYANMQISPLWDD